MLFKTKISGMMLLVTNEIISLHIDRDMNVQAYFYVNKKKHRPFDGDTVYKGCFYKMKAVNRFF